MLKLKLDFTTKCPLFTLGDSIKTFSLIELQIAGGDKSQKWKLSFGGFCGDYMGYLGPKTLNKWVPFLKN